MWGGPPFLAGHGHGEECHKEGCHDEAHDHGHGKAKKAKVVKKKHDLSGEPPTARCSLCCAFCSFVFPCLHLGGISLARRVSIAILSHRRSEPPPPPAPSPAPRPRAPAGVSSVGITAEGPLDFAVLNQYMMRLLQANARDIYRSKGVLCFEGQGDTKFVFQGVHEQIAFGPSMATWGASERRVSKMVFIGRNLNREQLEAGFRGCLAKK